MNLLKSLFFWLFIEFVLILTGGGTILFLSSLEIYFPEQIPSICGFLVSLISIALLLRFLFPETFKETVTLFLISYKNLKGFFVAFILSALMLCLIVFLGERFGLIAFGEGQPDTRIMNVIIQFLGLALIAGFAEESIFRGAVGTYFFKEIKVLPAIIIVSFLFSIGHIQYLGILPFITAFFFSIASFLLLLRTGSLYVSIGMHSGWNFTYYLFNNWVNTNVTSIPVWGNLFELLQIGTWIIVTVTILTTKQKAPKELSKMNGFRV